MLKSSSLSPPYMLLFPSNNSKHPNEVLSAIRLDFLDASTGVPTISMRSPP